MTLKRSKKKKRESTTWEFNPTSEVQEHPKLNRDAVYEMLCRFPAEDLHPLRAVCKQWLDTIDNDPHFPRLNFAHSEPGLLIQLIDYECSVRSYFMKVIHRASKAIVTFKPLNINPFVRIEGSCDALLLVRCVFDYVRFVINPLTETFVRLPPLPLKMESWHTSLGFDSRTGQYKVLWRLFHKRRDRYLVFIVRSSGGSWKMIEPSSPWLSGTGYEDITWIGGAWHFMIRYMIEQPLLVSLDASDEKFIQTPVPFPGIHGWTRLMELDGNVSVVTFTGSGQCDIWVLPDLYGGSGWKKKHSIEFDSLKSLLHGDANHFDNPRLLKNDVMVFQCKGWHAYDIKRDEGCDIETDEGCAVKGALRTSHFEIAHTNSLISWDPVP